MPTLEAFLNRASDQTLGRSLVEIFRSLDTDGTGRLGRKTIQDAMTKLKLDVSKRELDRAIYRFDSDADGCLIYVEFVRMLEAVLKIPHDEVLVRAGALAQAQRYTTASLWFHTLLTIPKSTLLRRIIQPVLWITGWSGLLAVLVRYGLVTQTGVLGLLLWPRVHTLLGGALGLLLVFRTNSAYARMWEGRQIWERISNLERDIARFVAMYEQNMGRSRAHRIAHLLCAYPVLLERHLSSGQIEAIEDESPNATAGAAATTDAVSAGLPAEGSGVVASADGAAGAALPGQSALAPQLKPMAKSERWSTRALPPEIRRALEGASNRPVLVCRLLGLELKQLYDLKVFSARESLFGLELVNRLSNCIGACERIVQTPVPLNYARHTSRFLTIWCLTLPLSLVGELGIAVVPAMAFVVWSLFGIQELGLTIEQPFEKQLRTDVLIASIIGDVQEALLASDSFPSTMCDDAVVVGGGAPTATAGRVAVSPPVI